MSSLSVCRRIGTLYLRQLRLAYKGMNTYQSGNAGPAMRQAMSALESWEADARPGDPPALALACALCEAAESIRARKGWPQLCDCPWPSWELHVARMLRAAERLCPMILDPSQCAAAGVNPER